MNYCSIQACMSILGKHIFLRSLKWLLPRTRWFLHQRKTVIKSVALLHRTRIQINFSFGPLLPRTVSACCALMKEAMTGLEVPFSDRFSSHRVPSRIIRTCITEASLNNMSLHFGIISRQVPLNRRVL